MLIRFMAGIKLKTMRMQSPSITDTCINSECRMVVPRVCAVMTSVHAMEHFRLGNKYRLRLSNMEGLLREQYSIERLVIVKL